MINLHKKQSQTFDKGMQAFDAGNVKDARKYLTDAIKLSQEIIMVSHNPEEMLQYADIIKEINELISLKLTEVGQTPPKNLFPFVLGYDIPIDKIPLDLRVAYSKSSAEDQKLITEAYEIVANPLNRDLFIGISAEDCLQGAIESLEAGDVGKAKELASATSTRLRIFSEQTSDPDVKETFLKMASFVDSKMNKKIAQKEKFNNLTFGVVNSTRDKLKKYIDKQEEIEYERYKNEGGPGIREGIGVRVAKTLLGNRSFYNSKTYHEIMYKGIDIIQMQYNQKKKFDAGYDALQKGRLEVARFLLYDAYCDALQIVSMSPDKNNVSEYEKMAERIENLMETRLSISVEDYKKQLKEARDEEYEKYRQERENRRNQQGLNQGESEK